jgi:hypothetical protein
MFAGTLSCKIDMKGDIQEERQALEGNLIEHFVDENLIFLHMVFLFPHFNG